MPALTASNGNDVVQTPAALGKQIIDYLVPSCRVLEPCIGDGTGFYNHLCHIPVVSADWCEISKGKDFFEYDKKVQWIITNPPYSQLLKFLEHSFKLADNVAMLILLPNCFQNGMAFIWQKSSM